MAEAGATWLSEVAGPPAGRLRVAAAEAAASRPARNWARRAALAVQLHLLLVLQDDGGAGGGGAEDVDQRQLQVLLALGLQGGRGRS